MIIGVPVVKNEPERAFVPLRSGRIRNYSQLFIYFLQFISLAWW